MCQLAEVSRAGYYRWLQRADPGLEQAELRERIQALRLANRFYGYRRITALLRADDWPVNAKRVLRLMRADNLLCLAKRAFVPATTDGDHAYRVYPNLTRRLITTGTDQLWVADITYVRLERAFVYLAVILDAHSRRAIGWALADHLRAELALAALDMALASRRVAPEQLIHHSDRGVQYACGDYIARLRAWGIQPSMSRVGCPYDNAKAESFMKTLKHEQVDGRRYRDLAEARADLGGFIETVYNRTRLHSALGYQAPAAYEDANPPLGPAGQPAPMAQPGL